MSPRARLLTGFLLANIAIAAAATLVLLNRPDAPPQIQGVLLPQPRPIPDFQLLDHSGQSFTQDNLLGQWHLVSYGFTTCPDICPTTLSQLVAVNRELESQGHSDLRVLFYSVDHRRDTVLQMASYMPFFHPDFIGLTHLDDSENPHIPFEEGLGIVAKLVPVTGPDIDPADNEYEVNHGVTLFLINPQGELQAIFQPDRGLPGAHNFSPEKLVRDYLAIRQYLG
jgi:protein SCO1/2